MAKKQQRWLVCGGRDFTDFRLLVDTMDDLVKKEGTPDFIIHGGATGADTIADKWAKFHGLPIMEFPANWKELGKSAGTHRNRTMLLVGRPSLGIAFPGGAGTADMVSQLKAAGIKVIHVKKRKANADAKTD